MIYRAATSQRPTGRACVVRMTEQSLRSQVLTLDRRDFSTYRRNGRDVIPLLAPER